MYRGPGCTRRPTTGLYQEFHSIVSATRPRVGHGARAWHRMVWCTKLYQIGQVQEHIAVSNTSWGGDKYYKFNSYCVCIDGLMYQVVWCWTSLRTRCSFKHEFRRWFLEKTLLWHWFCFRDADTLKEYLARNKRRKRVFGKWRRWNTFWRRRCIMQQGLVSGNFYVSLWICQTQLKIIHSWQFYFGCFNLYRVWANNGQPMSKSSKGTLC